MPVLPAVTAPVVVTLASPVLLKPNSTEMPSSDVPVTSTAVTVAPPVPSWSISMPLSPATTSTTSTTTSPMPSVSTSTPSPLFDVIVPVDVMEIFPALLGPPEMFA